MVVNAHKICDKCKDVVAIRHCVLFNTKKDFVTIRGDDIPTYVNYEDHTTPYKLHYCRTCWDGFVGKVEVEY